VPSVVAEGVVGAVLAVIHARMLTGEEQAWVELASPLMGMIVLPYLGAAAARRELARLEHLRLVERNSAEQMRNSWRLTPRGEAIELFIATRPSPR